MDNALTAPSNLPLAPANGSMMPGANAGLGQRWQGMNPRARWMLMVGVSLLIALLVGAVVWNKEGDYKVLFSGLSDKDGGAIIAQLSQMNVPYRYSEGGDALLVPASKVHEARLKLAAQGLPKSGVTGFELMDNAKFGQTQFQERLTFQRGLEGELTRTILAMPTVASARVHLALPNQNGFFREQQKPSASVMLSLHPGRVLDAAQIAGIVHLVSSSVPEMSPKSVSVLDQTGALLSANADNPAAGLDAQQLQYVAQIEQNYTQRIRELLEPLVGADNLRATVTAQVDFSQSEATSEAFKPNHGNDANAAVRSKQVVEQLGAGNTTPTGVPGAASNQPVNPTSAPINGDPVPLQAAGTGGAGGNQRRDSALVYEVDKTVRVTREATGVITRLNAAVVVNHRSQTDAKGKVTTTPLTPEEIDKLTALVSESIGFKQDRGDSVKVINAPFKVSDTGPMEELPLWKQPEILDMVRALGVPLGMGLLGLVAVFGLIRPAMKSWASAQPVGALASASGGQLNAVVDGQDLLPPVGGGGLPALGAAPNLPQLEQAREFARNNPAAAAQILRHWVSGEGA